MMGGPFPEYLYKYYSLDPGNAEQVRWRKEVLLRNKLYFPSRQDFNDPFDCKIFLDHEGSNREWNQYLTRLLSRLNPDWSQSKVREEVRKSLKKKKAHRNPRVQSNLREDLQREADGVGILSLSGTSTHPLMWAHYADSHRGFCLQFRHSASVGPFRGAQEVDYEPEVPRIRVVSATNDEILKKTFLTKAKFWDYEDEWRVLIPDGCRRSYSFPGELLTGLVLGHKASPATRDLLQKWGTQRKVKPAFFEARPEDEEFRMRLLPIAGA